VKSRKHWARSSRQSN